MPHCDDCDDCVARGHRSTGIPLGAACRWHGHSLLLLHFENWLVSVMAICVCDPLAPSNQNHACASNLPLSAMASVEALMMLLCKNIQPTSAEDVSAAATCWFPMEPAHCTRLALDKSLDLAVAHSWRRLSF